MVSTVIISFEDGSMEMLISRFLLKVYFWQSDAFNTSDRCEFSAEKVSWWDLPRYRELEDLAEDPEARIGTGDGDTVSQGDAACPVKYSSVNHESA